MVYDPKTVRTEYWWESKEPHSEIWASVEHLRDNQEILQEAYVTWLRLYSNRMASSYFGEDFHTSLDGGDRIRHNVVRSCIDTALAQIASNKSRPMHMVQGGSHDQKLAAEKLDKFILGVFHKNLHYDLSQQVFMHGCIWPLGAMKFYAENGQIKQEVVPTPELVFDPYDAKYNDPRQLFHVKNIDRFVLANSFPKFKEDIMDASMLEEDEESTTQAIIKPVTIIEAWHLPSGPGAKDGKHCIIIDGATLLCEEYDCDNFPFAFFRWSDAPFGFLGMGAAELLTPIQIEINYTAQKIQSIINRMAPVIFKQKGSGVGDMTNEILNIYEYTGKPPISTNTAQVPAELFRHLDYLIQRAYQEMGISQMSASSVKPGGLDSGEALRVFHDVGTQRFKHVGQRWAQFHVDCGERILDIARTIDKPIKYLSGTSKHNVEEITFKDIKLGRDSYIARVHPVNLLPDEPAGKVEMIQRLAQIDQENAKYYLAMLDGVPDVEGVIAKLAAPYKLANKMVDSILVEGEYMEPSPNMDLNLTFNIATMALLDAQSKDYPEERLELLERFIADVDGLQTLAQQGAAQNVGQPNQPANPSPQPAGPGAPGLAPATGPAPIPA